MEGRQESGRAETSLIQGDPEQGRGSLDRSCAEEGLERRTSGDRMQDLGTGSRG